MASSYLENINYPCLWVEFLITITITAYKLWSLYFMRRKKKMEQTAVPVTLPPPPYEEKYLTKFRETRDSRKHEVSTEEKRAALLRSLVMEKTPVGNVLMRYNLDRESFEYFSDVSVPYRYLEVVCRKYVLMFDCLELYIDMAEEINRVERETAAAAAVALVSTEEGAPPPAKKKVYATFKSYNKEGGGGKVNTAPPPKNSIPNRLAAATEEPEITKERVNRFSHLGKMVNFSFLQQVPRAKVEPRYAMSYRSFKMQQCNK
jgi:hypothetical protein